MLKFNIVFLDWKNKVNNMGLDFSHCDANWGYCGFARFRERLASEIGLNNYHEIRNTNDERFEPFKKDPIVYLLAHSDCDGHLTPTQCKKVAPRLRELVKDWDDDHDKQHALLLAEGMEAAAKEKKNLVFQ